MKVSVILTSYIHERYLQIHHGILLTNMMTRGSGGFVIVPIRYGLLKK